MSRFLSNLLRDSFLAGAAYFFLAVFFVTSAYAGAMPFLLLAGDTMGDADGEVKYFLKFKDTAGKDQEVTYAIGLVGGVTVRDSTIGEIIRDRLNSDARVKDEYEFSIKRRDDGYLQLSGAPKADKKPKATKESLGFDMISKRNKGFIWSNGIDPSLGIAQWDVFGEVSSVGRGQITIGIGGKTIPVDTFDMRGDKDIDQIKRDLVQGLKDAGFLSSFIDSTGLVTALNVSTGNLDSMDMGAFFMTTDADLNGFSVIIGPAIMVPEPTPVVLMAIGALVLLAGLAQKDIQIMKPFRKIFRGRL